MEQEKKAYALHKDDPMTKEEYLGEMINAARFCFSNYGDVDKKADHILANEYADFREFLEDKVDDYDKLVQQFFEKRAKEQVEAYHNLGYLKDYELPVKIL